MTNSIFIDAEVAELQLPEDRCIEVKTVRDLAVARRLGAERER